MKERATARMEAWAADNSHGYDQANRWGPDYDCSSAVISAWELAGVPVKTNGAAYTGNMRGVFLRCGFEDVTVPPESTGADTETSGDAVSSDADTSLTNEEAVEAAKAWLGETDPDTGYKYAYSFDGMDENGGEECFRIRVSWYLEDEDRYSLCGYLLVSEDGKNIQKFDW